MKGERRIFLLFTPLVHDSFFKWEDLFLLPNAAPFQEQEHRHTHATRQNTLLSLTALYRTHQPGAWGSSSCHPLFLATQEKLEIIFSLQYFYQYQYLVWTALNLWRASLITNTCSPSCPPWLFFLRHCMSLGLPLSDAGAQRGQLWGSGSSWGSWVLEEGEHQPWPLCPTVGQCRSEVVAELKLGRAGPSLWECSSQG